MITSAAGLNKFLFTLVLASLALSIGSAARAQVILVDDSNPYAVTFTATNVASSFTTPNPYSAYAGIDLVNFFTSQDTDPLTFFTPVGTPATPLTTGNGSSTVPFDQGASDNYVSPTEVDFNIFVNDQFTPATLTFTSGTTALTGILTLDLHTMAASLPGVGTGNEVVAGSSLGGTQDSIGNWVVVAPAPAPEPSTWMLLVSSVLLFAGLRRWRRA